MLIKVEVDRVGHFGSEREGNSGPVDQTVDNPHPSVLVVEDDASLLNALSFELETDGFHVFAYGRPSALLAAPRGADCMIIDMRLPDLDGLSLIGRLRQAGVLAPAILITTDPDTRTRRQAREMGVDIVEKPLITSELRRRIDELTSGVA